jgi:hypothetical protein
MLNLPQGEVVRLDRFQGDVERVYFLQGECAWQ